MNTQTERRLSVLKEEGFMTLEYKGSIYELEYDGWGYISNGRARSKDFILIILKDGIIK